MSLSMFRGVAEQAQHGGRELRPAHPAAVGEVGFVGEPQLFERPLHLGGERRRQRFRRVRTIAGVTLPGGLGLGGERAPLSFRELFAAGVSEQPVDHSRDVPEVEAWRGDPGRSCPEDGVGEAGAQGGQFVASLDQGVSYRLEQCRHAGHRPALPGFAAIRRSGRSWCWGRVGCGRGHDWGAEVLASR